MLKYNIYINFLFKIYYMREIKYIKSYFLLFILVLIFLVNLSISYTKYLDFIEEEIYEVEALVLNIYHKETRDILKLKAFDFTFFTSIDKNKNLLKFDVINIALITKRV